MTRNAIITVVCFGAAACEHPIAPHAVLSRTTASTPMEAKTVLRGNAVHWTTVSAGWKFTCGIGSMVPNGVQQLYCWGTNDWGQLGIGVKNTNPPDIEPPFPVAVDNPQDLTNGVFGSWSAVTTGSAYACGIASTDGTLKRQARALFCWGNNGVGQLGTNTISGFANFPQYVVDGESFASADAGDFAACGIKLLGRGTYCWGANSFGQAGQGDLTFGAYLEPTLIPSRSFSEIVHGWGHVCGIEGTNTYCWGTNGLGQLGDGTTIDRSAPTLLVGGPSFVSLTAGVQHSCGLTKSGKAYCWGGNSNGQLGIGTLAGGSTSAPTPVASALSFSTITAGDFITCGLSRGAAYCWGYGGDGELGSGNLASANSPTAVADGHTFIAISSGAGHTCAIEKSGDLYCWGLNEHGQLGSGAVGGHAATPTLVVNPYSP